MRPIGNARVALIVLALAAAGSVTVGLWYRALLATSGLISATSPGTGSQTGPTLHGRDTQLRTRTAHAEALRAGGPFSTEWNGYLIVPVSGRYRVVIIADDRASIEIDHQRVSGTLANRGTANFELTRGLHPVRLRYEDDGGRQVMEVLWARGSGVPASIEPLYLIPDLRPLQEVRARKFLSWALLAVPIFWSWLILVAGGVAMIKVVTSLTPDPDRSFLPAVLLIAAMTLICGVWWGLPDFYGWAPDELGPGDVNDALARHFAGGWATIYPPVHYAVLAVVTSPFHALAAMGLLELEQLHVNTAIFIVQRMVSVVMALGILGLVFSIGSSTGARAGAFAAAIVALALPFTYYGKVANVDVPYVFWLLLSLMFYLRMHRAGTTSDFLLFVLTGVLAIGSKDQAYGFYVLPAAVLAGSTILYAKAEVRPPGVPSPAVLGWMIAMTAVALIVVENALFNFSGVLEHLRIIVGPGSQGFRMYERGPAGQLRMLRDAFWQLGAAMSWPLFGIALAGVATAWRARVGTVRLLLLPLLSYYITFIAIVGYHYDRFFIGPVAILAIAAGWWLNRLVAGSGRAWIIRVALVCCAFAYALSRVAALDALMLFDSRYTIEQWVLQHAPGDARVAGAGQYLPRGGTLFWTALAQDPEALTTVQPDFVIINPAYTRRWSATSRPGQFYEALSGKDSAYKLSFRYQTYLWWSTLQFERRFRDSFDDPFSNLAKVNPLIEVYGR